MKIEETLIMMVSGKRPNLAMGIIIPRWYGWYGRKESGNYGKAIRMLEDTRWIGRAFQELDIFTGTASVTSVRFKMTEFRILRIACFNKFYRNVSVTTETEEGALSTKTGD